MLAFKRDAATRNHIGGNLGRPEFIRHRRALLAFSLAIVCFVAAGGKLTGASLLWGSISIARPLVLYLAAVAAFIHIRWEYRLAKPADANGLFALDVGFELLAHPQLNALVQHAKPNTSLAPESEIRVFWRRRPEFFVYPSPAGSAHPFATPLPRFVFWRAFVVSVYRAARHGHGFVAVVVPALLFWLAVACLGIYVGDHAVGLVQALSRGPEPPIDFS